MKLTEEQIAQCRKEFEAWASDVFSFESDGAGGYYMEYTQCAWIGFKAAWRPVPTVEQIEEIINKYTEAYVMMRVGVTANAIFCTKTAKVIRAAFGGKNER